jgi:hypothetical protein
MTPEQVRHDLLAMYCEVGGDRGKRVAHQGTVWEILSGIRKRGLDTLPAGLRTRFEEIDTYVTNHPELFPQPSTAQKKPVQMHFGGTASGVLSWLWGGIGRLFLWSGSSGSMYAKRDSAKEALIATGVSAEACQALSSTTPLLCSYVCQLLGSFDGGSQEPPPQVATLFIKEETTDRWVLNDTGVALMKSFGARRGPTGTITLDPEAVRSLCAMIEANLFRALTNIHAYIRHTPLGIPADALRSLEHCARLGQKVPQQEVEQLAHELMRHILSIAYPNGAGDIAASVPGLDIILYNKIFETGAKTIASAIVASVAQATDATAVQPPVDESLIDEFSHALVPLLGGMLMQRVPLPGFAQMAQRELQHPQAPTPFSLTHLLADLFSNQIASQIDVNAYDHHANTIQHELEEQGFAHDGFTAVTTVAVDLPGFICDSILFISEHPTYEPPGRLKKFFQYDAEHQTWTLNEVGYLVLKTMKNHSREIGMVIKTNLLILIRNVNQQLRAHPPLVLPPELLARTHTPDERARILTRFLLSRAGIESLMLPPLLHPLQPFMADLISPMVESTLRSTARPLLDREQAPPQLPALPHDIYVRYQALATALGPTMLSALPELAMLNAAHKDHPTTPDGPSLIALSGGFATMIGDHVLDPRHFDAPRSKAKEQLIELGFDEATIGTIGGTVTGVLQYIPTLLNAYHGHDSPPPGAFAALFGPPTSDGQYRLNEQGHAVLAILSNERCAQGLANLLETNALSAVVSLCHNIRRGTFKIPQEVISGTPSERKRALAEFLVSTLWSEPLAVPQALENVEPLIRKALQTLLSQGVFQQKTPASKPPQDIVQAFSSCTALGHLLGPTALALPEFGPLREAMKDDTTPHTEPSLSEFGGQMFRIVVDRLLHISNGTQLVAELKSKLRGEPSGMSETAVEYPGQLIHSTLTAIHQALTHPQQGHPSFLNPFFRKDSPGQLNEQGQLLLHLLSAENRAAFHQLIEANALQILLNITAFISDQQKANPYYLLDTVSAICSTLAYEINHAEERDADPKPLADDVMRLFNRVLPIVCPNTASPFILPDSLVSLNPLLLPFVRTLIPRLISFLPVDHPPEGMSTAEPPALSESDLHEMTPVIQRSKEIGSSWMDKLHARVANAPDTQYPRQEELRQHVIELLEAIFPKIPFFAHMVPLRTAQLCLPIGQIISDGLDSLPPPQAYVEKMFLTARSSTSQPRPEINAGAHPSTATTPATLGAMMRMALRFLRGMLRSELSKLDKSQHPGKTLALLWKIVVISILSFLPSKTILGVFGLSEQTRVSDFFKKFYSGFLKSVQRLPHPTRS